MKTAPRGIQAVPYKDSTYYRVRITRKDFKTDKYFHDLNEAKEFLALSKAKKGKELIYNITEEQRKKTAYQGEENSLGFFIDWYLDTYVLSRKPTNELEQRKQNNIKSFYKTIKNTSVLDRRLSHEEKQAMGIDTDLDKKVYRYFESFEIKDTKGIDINNYIKSRLHFVKPISVSREISFISNVFRKLQYYDEKLAEIPNPTQFYDKDLLRNLITKREVILSEEDEEKLFKVLQEKTNKELFKITKLSLLTGMRRSEVILLNKNQIKDTFISLTHTKSGNSRKVYLTPQAKEFLETLTPLPNGKYFKYTIGGFDRVFREVMKRGELSHIHFHDLRRTNISRLLSRIGQDNTILATEILGLQSIRKFEQLHSNVIPQAPTNQSEAVKNWHGSLQVTKGYFNIVFNTVKK